MTITRFLVWSVISTALGMAGGAALLCGARVANDYQAPLGTEWAPPYCAPGVRTGGAGCREGWDR